MDAGFLLPQLGVLSVGLCMLLSMFLLVANGSLKRANRFLAAFLLLTAIDMTGWIGPLLPPALQEILPYRLPLAFLQMPVLFAYGVALCFPARRSQPHVIAGMLASVASALSLAPQAGAQFAANSVALHLQFYVYILLMAALLRDYRRCYRQTYSHPQSLTFKWLALVVGVSFGAHTLVLLKSWAWHGQQPVAPVLELVVALIAVAVSCALTLSAMLRQDLFLGIPVELSAADDPGIARVTDQAYPDQNGDAPSADHVLTGQRFPTPPQTAVVDTAGAGAVPNTGNAEQVARVQAYMRQQEPFLDPSLTIRSLARRLGMGQRELSNLINQALGAHFFDFVNQHRVEKAAALLRDPANADAGILELAYAAGFNTKSSFNAAFRKHLGMTPSAYRQQACTPPADHNLSKPA